VIHLEREPEGVSIQSSNLSHLSISLSLSHPHPHTHTPTLSLFLLHPSIHPSIHPSRIWPHAAQADGRLQPLRIDPLCPHLVNMALYFAVENEGDEERFNVDLGDIELRCDGGNLDARVAAGGEQEIDL